MEDFSLTCLAVGGYGIYLVLQNCVCVCVRERVCVCVCVMYGKNTQDNAKFLDSSSII